MSGRWIVATGLLVLLLSGCELSGGSGSGSASGTVSLAITDGPVDDAEHVYVQFSGVEFHAASGQTTTVSINPPEQVDLVQQVDGASAVLLNDVTLPAGQYNWIRLQVDTADTRDTYAVINGAEYELTIPSGAQSGLKLVRGFTIPVNAQADFTIDFDLRKSLHSTGNGRYILRPTLRLVDNAQVGAIAGDIAPSSYGCAETGVAVYVYGGSGVTPVDINIDRSGGVNPVTVAPMRRDQQGRYYYRAAFLAPGPYTVALTCESTQDDAEQDDAIAFQQSTDVTVETARTTRQDFLGP